MTNEPPVEPIQVRARSGRDREGERWYLENKYRDFKIAKEPYRRQADGYDYWVFVAPIRIGWFVPDDPGEDRKEVQKVWKRPAKDEPVEKHGEKCWDPVL